MTRHISEYRGEALPSKKLTSVLTVTCMINTLVLYKFYTETLITMSGVLFLVIVANERICVE